MTLRKYLLAAGAAAALFGIATTASLLGNAPAEAQNGCSASCRTAYGACYKSSQDRARCQAQLQRCLESCIRSKR